MIDTDHIVLGQGFLQRDLTHSFVISGNSSDFIAEIVGLLDIGNIPRIFMEQIALGEGSVEGLLQIFLVLPGQFPVQRLTILGYHVGHINRFFHASFDFQRIYFLQIFDMIDGIQILRG